MKREDEKAMNLQLLPVGAEEMGEFKSAAQEAFQEGFERVFGRTERIVLPEKDIDSSLHAAGAAAYKAVLDGRPAGGAVVINEKTRHDYLDLLFVRPSAQGKGVGKAIWEEIERRYPETEVWETCTPYFDRRNVHFYVNVCGFHITEQFNEKHPMPNTPEDFNGDGGEGMFVFEKRRR